MKKILLYTLSAGLLAGCSFLNKSVVDQSASQKMSSYKGITATDWQIRSKSDTLKGWDFVAEKLISQNIQKKVITEIFSHPDMPSWTPITFKVKPKESSYSYRNLNSVKNRQNAIAFYSEYKESFKSAQKLYAVPAEYILAILQVETQCGKNTGNDPIFYWLARLISTGFPPNIDYNVENSEETPRPSYKEFEERAAWLEEEFTPHLVALIKMSQKANMSPLEVKGSKGGALGYPQFLPGNIARYGVDGDKNGSINIFTAPDAIHSVAYFLKKHGWKSDTQESIMNTILEYNRSTAYAETVMEMAQDLKRMM